MTLARALLLVLAVVLAGCVGSPAPGVDTATESPGRPTTGAPATPDAFALAITVEGDGPVAVTVHAVENGTDGLRVYYGTETSRTYPEAAVPADLPPGALDGATGVEPLADAPSVSFDRRYGTRGVTFSHPGGTAAVLYVVSTPGGPLQSAAVVACESGTLSALRLTVDDGAVVGAGHQCRH